MPNYQYKGRDKQTHKAVHGLIQAANPAEAARTLRGKGILVLSVTPHQAVATQLSLFNKVSNKDRIIFTRELAVMVKAGLPIVQALKALEDQTENKRLVKIVHGVVKEVEGGTSLSEAFAHYPQAFPPIFVSVSRIGEKSGKLEEVLNRLANQLEKDEELASKVTSAMIYPAFILVSLVSVLIVIMVYIIPQLRTIFDDAGIPLPALTRAMLQLSVFMQQYIAGILIALVGLVIGGRFAMRQPAVAKTIEKIYFKTPVLGALYRQVLMTRFTHTLATLLSAGLPMIDALKTTAEVMNSPAYLQSLQGIVKQVENGGSLSKAILTDKHYPSMVGHMISIGEDSGNIDSILETVGLYYDKEVDALTRNLSASLEPILMLAMGLGVGLVVASVITPMYGLVNAI